MKKWANDHLIFVWVISSILFAFIIHCLFSKPAPNELFVAEWSAGDILTYVSTIALGLLAVWQNNKFKEESDKSQNRMEQLTIKANELAIVSKIIEYESARISQLNAKSRNFIDACNTENASLDISDVGNQPDDFKKIYIKIKMDNRCSQIMLFGIELLCELGLYNTGVEVTELIKLVSKYSETSIALVKEISTASLKEVTYRQKEELEKQCIQKIFNFISSREEMLNKVIYSDLSFTQIKEMYGEIMNKDVESDE